MFGGLMLIGVLAVTGSARGETSLISAVLFLLGVGMAGVAVMGRLWCSLYISGYKNETLITLGPYSICRNPLYFFSLIGAVGVGFATETLTLPAVILVGFALYYPFVIRREERLLRERHGESYAAYCREVPRFFPAVSRLREPETHVVIPAVMKRRLWDSFWFIGALGILELMEGLHEGGFLPVWFRLY
ncbi:MAG: methyltransferase [Planctomycetota bacterium]